MVRQDAREKAVEIAQEVDAGVLVEMDEIARVLFRNIMASTS